jgi:DNA-binding PadR family transcriptional regulator
MHSPVNWALLGLIIERPSYAYELAKRFDRTYGSVLSLSSVSHAYTAIAALRDRGLISELPGSREGAQPKPRYEATETGIREYGSWLVAQADEDGRRQHLFVLQLARFARQPQMALAILDRYEQACLAQAQRSPIAPTGALAPDSAPELAATLAAEELRLSLGAKIQWVQYARAQLNTRAASRTPRP